MAAPAPRRTRTAPAAVLRQDSRAAAAPAPRLGVRTWPWRVAEDPGSQRTPLRVAAAGDLQVKAIAPDLLYRHSEPAPRYTSYPTVMYWKSPPAEAAWTGDLSAALALPSAHLGLYVHIPFCQALCSFCGCNIRVVRNHALAQPYVETVLREFARYRERLAGAHLLIGELHLGGGSPTFLPAQVLDRLLDGI